MTIPSRAALSALAASEANTQPRVSLYMPTIQAGTETQQNSIRFKNLLREAEGHLEALNMEASAQKALMAQAWELYEDAVFWDYQYQGLALFLAEGVFQYYRLPLKLPELVTVKHNFHLKPLFPLLSGDGAFYILALSQQRIRLLAATRHHVHELGLSDEVPLDLDEDSKHDGNEGVKQQLHKTFSQLDKNLEAHLRLDDPPPMVLAGVEYVMAIYREVSGYPNLLAQGVDGNPDDVAPETLHEQAWPIVDERFTADREAAIGMYHQLSDTQKQASTIESIVPAAYEGRVDTIFADREERIRGRYHAAQRDVELDPDADGTADDLLDLAVIQSWLNGARVYVSDREHLPNGHPVAAIFRY